MVIGLTNSVVEDDDDVDGKSSSVALDVGDVIVATSSKPTGVRPVVCSMIFVIKLGAYANKSVVRRCCSKLIRRRRGLGDWKARTTFIPSATSGSSSESAKRLCRRR